MTTSVERHLEFAKQHQNHAADFYKRARVLAGLLPDYLIAQYQGIAAVHADYARAQLENANLQEEIENGGPTSAYVNQDR